MFKALGGVVTDRGEKSNQSEFLATQKAHFREKEKMFLATH